jgi:superfamily II DNA or RNA helicase
MAGPIGLRQFQAELYAWAERVLGGTEVFPKTLYLPVTPGGGKQVAALLLAHLLIPSHADRLCWVVPRDSLQRQAEETFTDPTFIRMLGHDRRIRISTNDYNPSRGQCGFVTTYQAVGTAAGWKALVDEFERHRYLLFLDEPHHVEADGTWARALAPLVQRAVLVALASGTFSRHDGKPIAFTDYERRLEDGKQYPVLTTCPERPVIRYSRRAALVEHAIIPVEFFYQDAHAEWLDREGITRTLASLRGADPEDSRAAVSTMLETGAAGGILARATGDWLDWRARHPRAKLLLVVHKIQEAKRVLRTLREGYRIDRAGIATSEDSPEAKETIRRFRLTGAEPDRIDVLVTVQIAYEGLDCKPISHVVCLTHIRSRPWIEQMIARGTRYDPEGGRYETQWCFVYGPDDPLLVAICEAIRAEQEAALRERRERDEGTIWCPGPQDETVEILPLGSGLTHERVETLHTGESSDDGDDEALLEELRLDGLANEFNRVREAIRRADARQRAGRPTGMAVVELTPSQREEALRRHIERYARTWEGRHPDVAYGTVNGACYARFGKSRKDMEEWELTEAWAWMLEAYPQDWA